MAIQRGMAIIPAKGSSPMIVSNERAVLPCGCAVYVGVRTDKQKPNGKFESATMAAACSPEHHGLIDALQREFKKTLPPLGEPADPDRPVVEVIDEILTAVAADA